MLFVNQGCLLVLAKQNCSDAHLERPQGLVHVPRSRSRPPFPFFLVLLIVPQCLSGCSNLITRPLIGDLLTDSSPQVAAAAAFAKQPIKPTPVVLLLSIQRQNGKRSSGEDDGQESSGGAEHKKVRLDSPHDPETRRLACPYFKNNPLRYRTWQSCPGPVWITVHRLKYYHGSSDLNCANKEAREHLYRRHALPITCHRCHEVFDATTLRDDHLVADERCQIRR